METAERIRRGDVSAVEVVEAAIAAAEAARGLGAVVAEAFERAREATVRPTGGAFAGVPTFVKDLARVRGLPTTWGSRAAGTPISRRNDPFVTRMERTGVIFLGKSATPELGMTATTEALGRPPARNPWDPTRSTGGSSGGAAALVAAGVVPLAHGSDGGGSIRIPAACCGLVGLKPTRSRMDMEASNLLPVNVATHGVLTRSVRDTVAFHRALTPLGDVAPEPERRLRIGAFVDAPAGTPVHPEVRAAVVEAGRTCRELGHEVEEIACPFDVSVTDDFLTYWGFVAWIQLRSARLTLHHRFDATKIEPWTAGLARSFLGGKLAALQAIRRLRSFARRYAELMKRYDVLLSPTLAEPAPPLGHLAPDLPFEVKFQRLRSYAPFTPIYNAAGAPAISLPLGRTLSGLPIGVQLAAAPGADARLLSLALSLEAARPWPLIAPESAWSARAAQPVAG